MDARWHVEQLQRAALSRGTRVGADDLAQRGAVDIRGVVEVEHQFHSALADELSDHIAKDVRTVLDSDPPVDVDDRDVVNPALVECRETPRFRDDADGVSS